MHEIQKIHLNTILAEQCLPKGGSSDARILRRRILDYYLMWNLLDMDKLAPFYHKAPDVVIFNDVEPVKFNGWKEFRRAEEQIMAKMSWWKSTPENLTVSVWDDVALSTATPILTGESKAGKKYSLTLRHTAVWRKKGNQWLIVHDHWSIPWPSS